MHKDAFLFSGHAPIPSTRGIPQIILGIPQKSLWYAPNCEGTNEFKTYHNCLSWHATILLHFKKTGAYLISVPNRTTICLALRATFACRIVACHNSTVHLFAPWLRGGSYREIKNSHRAIMAAGRHDAEAAALQASLRGKYSPLLRNVLSAKRDGSTPSSAKMTVLRERMGIALQRLDADSAGSLHELKQLQVAARVSTSLAVIVSMIGAQ